MEGLLHSAGEVLGALVKSDRTIKDDTQLEKFVGWITGLTIDEGAAKAILEVPGIFDFFGHVGSEEKTGTFQSLVVALRLAPHFAMKCSALNVSSCPLQVQTTSECEAFPFWLKGIMDAGEQPEYWEEGSVRHAWISGVLLLCASRKGLCWTLTQGYLARAVGCLHDRSMFVSSLAQEIVCCILPHLPLSQPTSLGSTTGAPKYEASHGNHTLLSLKSRELEEKLKQELIDPLTCNSWKFSKILIVLKVIESLCQQEEKKTKNFIADQEMAHHVLKLFLDDSVFGQSAIIQQGIRTLTALSSTNPRRDFQDKIKLLPMSMLRQLRVQPAMTLAAQLISTNFSMDKDQLEALQELIALPVLLILESTPVHLDNDITARVRPLLERSVTGCRLIHQSVHLMSTMELIRRQQCLPLVRDLLNTTLGVRETSLSRYVKNNSKLQIALVNFIIQVIQAEEPPGQLATMDHLSLFQQMLLLLATTGLAATLTLKTFQCILCFLHHITNLSVAKKLTDDQEATLQTSLQQFAESLQQSLCDLRWEVRDSALEVTADMVQRFSSDSVLWGWLGTWKMGHQVWMKVQDGESYVRATAIKALGNISLNKQLWQQVTRGHPEAEIVQKLITILQKDTEAFPRRCVIKLLTKWLQADTLSNHTKMIQSAVNDAIHDLDWEVKLSVLQFWQQVISDKLTDGSCSVPAYAAGLSVANKRVEHKDGMALLEEICEMGGWKCLLVGIRDYDQSVRHKACSILVEVKFHCKQVILSNQDSTEPPRKQHCPSLAAARNFNVVTDLTIPDSIHASPKMNEQSDVWDQDTLNIATTGQFLHFLESVNLDRLAAETSESTDDYVRNPMSLLDDILISLGKDDDENAVDCY